MILSVIRLKKESIMIKMIFIFKIFVFCLFVFSNVYAKNSNFFDEGKELFEKEKYEKSKIFFQKDIVHNPKNERSYLYLAKIFAKNNDADQEEMKLNNVILLNPNNDEALYLLILHKIKQSDYNSAKELIEKFELICKTFCSKKSEIKEKFSRLIPENENNKN